MAAKPFVQLTLWRRAVLTNAAAAVGIYIGLASSTVQLSVNADAYIAVFTIAMMNLMILVVMPRIHAQKTAGVTVINPWRVVYEVLAERPFITVLLILQLIGVSQGAATAIVLMQASASNYVHGLPNVQSMTLRLIGASVLMAGIAVLWLLGAVGLWQSRPWAWWLILVLNGLSATVSGALQVFRPDKFLVDIPATAAVVLLLLRPVRVEFRHVKTAIKQIAT
jgi:uncharacterized protein YjeT (DUF2065 family)